MSSMFPFLLFVFVIINKCSWKWGKIKFRLTVQPLEKCLFCFMFVLIYKGFINCLGEIEISLDKKWK